VDVAEWLRSVGLEQYTQAFRDNDIEAETLPHLTVEDLGALGVASIGHRRKLLTAIAALHSHANQGVPRAERRQLTVMFIDLVGSTALSERLDPEDMRDIIRRFQGAVSAEIARFDGMVAKLMGDAVLAYFGWPRAHEDDAERAVRAALAATAAVSAQKASGTKTLASRSGIATGLVVVGDLAGEGAAQEEAVVGDTPNLAARLQAIASPNSIVIADGTCRLIRGLFDVTDLGDQELKGFAKKARAWRVVGEAEAESRFEARQSFQSPIFGRASELGTLLECWQQARQGFGRIALVSGEPGIGKSRLNAEKLTRQAASRTLAQRGARLGART